MCKFDTDVKIELELSRMVEKNQVFIQKVHIKTHRLSKKKDVLGAAIFQETKNYNLIDKNHTKIISNAIFNMKKVDLDES